MNLSLSSLCCLCSCQVKIIVIVIVSLALLLPRNQLRDRKTEIKNPSAWLYSSVKEAVEQRLDFIDLLG